MPIGLAFKWREAVRGVSAWIEEEFDSLYANLQISGVWKTGSYEDPAWIATLSEDKITDGTLLARLADNETVTGDWTFSGQTSLQDRVNISTTSYTLTGTANPLDSGDYVLHVISQPIGGTLTIYGLSGGVEGRIVWVVNSRGTIIYRHNDGGAGQGLLTPTEMDYPQTKGQQCLLVWTSGYWRPAVFG